MRDAVIVAAVRTPVGKRNGGLSGVHPVDLSAHVLRSISERTGIDPAVVDDVVWGCVGQVGEQTFEIARHAVLAAGPSRCRAGGVESMSRVPMGAAVATTDGVKVSADEGVRRGGSVKSLAKLKPAFKPDGVIHAGNSSQINDGAAGLLIMTSEKAKRLGLTPLARVHTAVVAAETGAKAEALNPNGGAIALGHPLGGSGARLMTTLIHHMRDNGIRYGLQTKCEGGGQANATILEAL